MIQPHYFDQLQADSEDVQLRMAIGQGYVPAGCLLPGVLAMGLTTKGQDPCRGCAGPRDRCGGRPRAPQEELDEEVFRAFRQQLGIEEPKPAPPRPPPIPRKIAEPEPPEPGPDQLDIGRPRP